MPLEENDSLAEFQKMEDGTEYQVLLRRDPNPEAPYDDGQWPIIRWTYRFGFAVEEFNDAGKPFVEKFREVADRLGWDHFPRYLRIFHGVTTVHEYGPNNFTDYTYVAFDTAAWREEHGVDLELIKAEDPLSEIRAWIEGDVYGVITERRGPLENEDWEEVESVWGYYGDEYAKARAKEALAEAVASHKTVYRYPEAEKLSAKAQGLSTILEFIEWAQEKDLDVHDIRETHVHEFYGIDSRKLEAERRLMLQRLTD